jgi:tetratricopeptide (TPR) repeat protein
VAPETSRIAELRRRVQADPASIAFAQLAEEHRRAGDLAEAIACCRAGLAHHPGYHSARVTLGRALLDLGRLDEAAGELDLALRSAPENLTALRARADIFERVGELPQALELYKRALAVARFDPYLEGAVTRIDREMAIAGDPSPEAPRDPPVDFDALLASLGAADAAPPPAVERLLSAEITSDPPLIADLPETNSEPDLFAVLEDELRAFTQRTPARTDDRVLEELEAWLRALQQSRRRTSPG